MFECIWSSLLSSVSLSQAIRAVAGAAGQCSSTGQSLEERLVLRYVGAEQERVVGLSRIDQALKEADCATFEEEGTITLLGSVSHRRGSQTTRGKHSDFCTGSPLRLLPGPDKTAAVPRHKAPQPGPGRSTAFGPPPQRRQACGAAMGPFGGQGCQDQ